jgi:hypothetical protein
MKTMVNVYRPLAALGASLLIGCGAAPDETGQDGLETEVDAENTGQIQQSLGNPGDVGIIPNGASCPAGVHLGIAYMDTEDDNGQTAGTSWKGSWTLGASSGVSMRVCRVPGSWFKPLTTDPNAVNRFYAVLQMGETCPAQSVPFTRNFDNEDDANGNSVTQEIDPSVVNSNTSLKFCLFRNASSAAGTMSDFPFIFSGMEYGIFAKSSAPPFVIQTGSVYTDDEDDGNTNSLTASSANIVAQAGTIITPGSNTRMFMTRVW